MKFPRNMEFYLWERRDMAAPPINSGRNTNFISIFSDSIKDAEDGFQSVVKRRDHNPDDYWFVGTRTIMKSMLEFERYA